MKTLEHNQTIGD